MEWLDANADVRSYSYEGLAITYVANVKTRRTRTYYPDFVVVYDERLVVVEIKPKKRLSQLRVRKKIDAGRAWCEANGAEFEIITEVELKSLGIL